MKILKETSMLDQLWDDVVEAIRTNDIGGIVSGVYLKMYGRFHNSGSGPYVISIFEDKNTLNGLDIPRKSVKAIKKIEGNGNFAYIITTKDNFSYQILFR